MSTKTAYRAGWLIDGSGAPAVKDRIIVVQDGSVIRICGPDDPDVEGLSAVDWSDCTVFPALIDSHVHLVMSGTTDPCVRKKQLNNDYEQRREIIAAHLKQYLAHGVMAVRDGGDHNGDVLRYKSDPSNGSMPDVTVAAPGRARRAQGRYGKLIGIEVAKGESLAESFFKKESCRDHLKIVNSGLNSLTQFGVESAPQFDGEELERLVAKARKRGLTIMVHANGALPVKLAVEAGCDSIEHGFFMGRDNMLRMADSGATWVPTAVTMKAYSDYLEKQGHRSDPSFAEVSRRNLEHQLEQISIARELGVKLALGTDAGSPGVHHGSSIKTELLLFVAAGFTVEEAVRCASRNGALLMGLSGRGKIAPGMRADFLAVRALPDRLPKSIDRIIHRVIAGASLDSAA
jgi:imidazolonepropionase-like amidohydrolase